VLEFGCGDGTLARAMHEAGYDVLAIDPGAPEGPIFRPLKLEELEEDLHFDAVVESRALHHVADLGAALDKVQLLLDPGGRLLLDEFAWDRLDERTADWYYGQLRALAAAGRGEAPPTLDALREDWEAEHVGLHGFDAMRIELDRRFRELHFRFEPYLYRFLDGIASEELERTLINAGAIQAIGFRYVGEPR
jgi:SAM-dependent methyltransferase